MTAIKYVLAMPNYVLLCKLTINLTI